MPRRSYCDSFKNYISSPFVGAAVGTLMGGMIDSGRYYARFGYTPYETNYNWLVNQTTIPFCGVIGLAVSVGYWFLQLERTQMVAFEEEFTREDEDPEIDLDIDFSLEVEEQKKETVSRAGLFSRKKTFTQELLAINFDFKNVPDNLCCPITKKLINDPVLLVGDGRAYERSAIERHLSKRGISPFSGKELTAAQCRLIENFNKRAEIDAFVEQLKKARREEKCEVKLPKLSRSRSI